MSNSKGKHTFRYKLGPETFGYTLVLQISEALTSTKA